MSVTRNAYQQPTSLCTAAQIMRACLMPSISNPELKRLAAPAPRATWSLSAAARTATATTMTRTAEGRRTGAPRRRRRRAR